MPLRDASGPESARKRWYRSSHAFRHAGSGSTLVLSRLSDAVAQLRGVDGLQVHRSWWVADSAVVAVRRNGSALTLKLRNGIEAPVSRTHLQAVRARGWARG